MLKVYKIKYILPVEDKYMPAAEACLMGTVECSSKILGETMMGALQKFIDHFSEASVISIETTGEHVNDGGLFRC